MRGRILFVTGTGTGVGKTVVTAAVAALEPGRVAVLKPAQTGVDVGQDGDLAEVRRLSGIVGGVELGRYPGALAPATAARRAGAPPVRPGEIAAEAARLVEDHDLVLVEGAGGVLVRFDDHGGTLADAAAALPAPVLVVTHAGLGSLNAAALTVEALARRGLSCPGLVIGAWPPAPDLACRCNVRDLPGVTDLPLLGALPDGAASVPDSVSPPDPGSASSGEVGRRPTWFRDLASRSLSSCLGGSWNANDFTRTWCPGEWR